MRTYLFLLSFFFVGGILAQPAPGTFPVFPYTYPYPEPKPPTGQTPNTVVRASVPIAPSAYNNYAPTAWDTDIGGGLQSRTNETDRYNVRWLRLGSIVFDQTDRWYYGADIVPGTTNIIAWRQLFTLDGGGGGPGTPDINIYKDDGTLTANRLVTMGANSLTFSGASSFSVNATGTTLTSVETTSIQAKILELIGQQQLRLKTPGVLNSTVTNGWVLTLTGGTNGTVEFQPAVTSGTNATPDINIYKDDGVITGTRNVNINGQQLNFNGGGELKLEANSTLIKTRGALRLVTSNLFGPYAGGYVGMALRLANTNGQVDFSPEPVKPDLSIYTDDSYLTQDRIVTGTGLDSIDHSLLFWRLYGFSVTDGNTFYVATTNIGLYATNIDIRSPGSVYTTGSVLTYTNGVAKWLPNNGPNIYNTNGTLTADRVLTGGGRDLFFDTIDEFRLISTNTTLSGLFALNIVAPGLASAGQDYVLALTNTTTGGVAYKLPRNIYNVDGTLTGNRILSGGGFSLNFTNLSAFTGASQYTLIQGVTNLTVRTPGVVAGSIATNTVLTLVDLNGKVEFTPKVTDTDTTFYDRDGSLSGARTVTLNGMTLAFTGAMNQNVNWNSIRYFGISSATNNQYSTDEYSFGSPLRVKMIAPKSNTPIAGSPLKTLTLMDEGTSIVEFRLPQNIYTKDGTITGVSGTGNQRTVDGANSIMMWQNFYDVETRAQYVIVQATNEFRLKTPKVIGNTASAGWVLALTNASTGQAEFQPINVTGGDGSIYLGDGSLGADRTVNQAGKFLVFNSAGTSYSITNAGIFRALAVSNYISASGKFFLSTPNVVSGGAPAHAGKVLTLASDGTSEFQPIPPGPFDTTIYNSDGSLTGHRFLNGVGFNLTFINVNTLTSAGLIHEISGLSQMRIKTPLFQTNPSLLVNGQVLTLMDKTTGLVEYQNIPTVNIYNTSGTITSTRTVNLGAQTLSFQGPGNFIVSAATIAQIGSSGILELSGVSAFKVRTPQVIAASPSPAIGSVLTLQSPDGTSEFQPLPPGVNIYTANGSLTGTRIVTLAGRTLYFQGPGNVALPLSGGDFSVEAKLNYLSGVTTVLSASSLMQIATPRVLSVSKPAVGEVLTLLNQNGTADYSPAPNIYTTSGTLTSSRSILGGGNTISFSGNSAFSASGGILTLGASSSFNIATPLINGGFGGTSIGWVLTLQDSLGKVEYAPIPAVNTFYTGNGSLNGPRTVTMGANSLTFNTTGGTGHVNWNMGNANFVVASAGQAVISSAITSIQGTGEFRLLTPAVSGPALGRPANGTVLTMMNNATGLAEFQPPPSGINFYTSNGDLTSARAVNGAGFSLSFGNLSSFTTAASSVTLAAPNNFYLRTPQWFTGSRPANGTVLTMTDNTVGKVEFQAVTTPPTPPDTSIYIGNGAITSARTVTQSTFPLTFQSSSPSTGGAFAVQGGPDVRIQGKITTIEALSEANLGELRIKTPGVLHATSGSRPPVNSVLTLKDRDTGKAEFTPVTGLGALVYNGNGREFSASMPTAFSFFVTALPEYLGIPQYPFGTVLNCRLTMDNFLTWDTGGNNVSIQMSGAGGTYRVYAPDGSNPRAGDIIMGSVVSLVFLEKIGQPGVMGWCMMNTGWRSVNKP